MTISDDTLYRLRQDSGDIAATPDLSTEEIEALYTAAIDYEAAVLQIVEKRWVRALAAGDKDKTAAMQEVVMYWRTRQPLRVTSITLGLDAVED